MARGRGERVIDLFFVDDAGDPATDGQAKYVAGDFRMRDQFGVFNPRTPADALAPAVDRIALVKDNGQPYIKIDGSGWQVMTRFEFSGTDVRIPTGLRVVAQSKAPGDTFQVRVWDVDNAIAIAVATALAATTWSILDLGTISSLSADPAVWELQGQKNSDEGELASLLIEY